MLLKLPDVRDQLDVMLGKWLSLYGPLESLLQLYFFGQYAQDTFPVADLRLVSLVQALESYHRIRLNKPSMDKDTWKERVSRITSLAEEDEREWVKRKLALSNQQTLHERLEAILDLTEPLSSHLIGDRAAFLKSLKDTRNYFTHYDRRLERKRLQGVELFKAISILVMVVEMTLLMEIGFTAQEAAARVMSTSRFRDRDTFEVVSWDLGS